MSTKATAAETASCANCRTPIVRCPDHAPIIFGQCGGWLHPDGRYHLCNPGGYPPRIAEPQLRRRS